MEQELASLASATHGVVTREQLLRAGITPGEIKQRLRTGALLRVHRAVYRVGHRAPSVEARYLASVWACGAGSLLCDAPAGHVFRLVKGPPPAPVVLTATERRVAGVRTRHSRQIEPRDATVWRGIPVTTISRTLVDLAATLGRDDLARACHEAGVLYRTTPRDVAAVLARRPRSPGAARLREILLGEVRVTLSALERRFLTRLREAGLVLPDTNRPAGGRRVDCRWPRHRLTVELDSYRYHHSRHAWVQD
nr:type IV toxin-antitoxin system AbiEi family antitoxin domain-containing protein [Solirubrobacterales bacterium]